MKVLLVNPPIHDFTAYDFWLKPYGLLRVAGNLRGRAELHLFDYLDRLSPLMPDVPGGREDRWGRGTYFAETVPKPPEYKDIQRYYRRFGIPRKHFQEYLLSQGPFDWALVQTVMTYWYLGVQEVIQDIRAFSPTTKIVLGGVYASIMPRHATNLGADVVIQGVDLAPLWKIMGCEPDPEGIPFWEGYDKLTTGVIKLADGCPFRCSYCSVPNIYPKFTPKPIPGTFHELEHLTSRGARTIALYDDALLYRAKDVLVPFLEGILDCGMELDFHTPNALNVRFLTRELANLMVEAGFKTFYLGFESSDLKWQQQTGGKVLNDELARAVDNLNAAGADPTQLTAYLILSHPHSSMQELETTMRFVHHLGLHIMLAEYSPIVGTPDGEYCRQWVNLEEPLFHNKTVFPCIVHGVKAIDQMKTLARELNSTLTPVPPKLTAD